MRSTISGAPSLLRLRAFFSFGAFHSLITMGMVITSDTSERRGQGGHRFRVGRLQLDRALVHRASRATLPF